MRQTLRIFALSLPWIIASAPVFAQSPEVEDLKQMIEQQQRQIEAQQEQLNAMRRRLEKISGQRKEAATAKAVADANSQAQMESGADAPEPAPETPRHIRLGDSNVLTTGTFEGSYELPDTGFSMRLGGYVKADLITDFGEVGNKELFVTSSIPVDGPGDDDVSTRLHARQSRLNLDARLDTDHHEFRAFIEGDFFGGSNNELFNSHSFRLRHAFGSYGPVLAGQTWSAFMDVDVFPETVDFEGPPGMAFVRQPQFRLTKSLGERVSVAASIENPEGDVLDNNGNAISGGGAPDGTARVRYSPEWGHVQLGGLVRQVSADDQGAIDDEAFGWGANVSGRLELPALGENDNFVFQWNYGDGIGRYILDIAGLGSDAAVNPATNRIQTLHASGGYVGYQHWWKDNLRSTVTAGYASLDSAAFQAPDTFDSSQYVAGNLIWSPIPQLNLGGEFLHGRRENKNGEDGEASRLQLSAQFLF
jgi:uncharacterized coiled-coil protein SlyX